MVSTFEFVLHHSTVGSRCDAALEVSAGHWDSILDCSRRNGVLPGVAWNLRGEAVAPIEFPAEVERQLVFALMGARSRCHQYADHLANVLREFDATGRPFALTKGAALLAALVPADARFLNDFDLLIRSEDYDWTRQQLLDAGFEVSVGDWQETEHHQRQEDGQITFVKEIGESRLIVDLHWALYPARHPFFLSTESVLERSTAGTFVGLPVQTVCREDLFLHYAMQLLSDRLRMTLLRLTDLHLLLRSGIDWSKMRLGADEERSRLAVQFAVAAVEDLFGSGNPEIPEWARSQRVSTVVQTLRCATHWPWREHADERHHQVRRAAEMLLLEGRWTRTTWLITEASSAGIDRWRTTRSVLRPLSTIVSVLAGTTAAALPLVRKQRSLSVKEYDSVIESKLPANVQPGLDKGDERQAVDGHLAATGDSVDRATFLDRTSDQPFDSAAAPTSQR